MKVGGMIPKRRLKSLIPPSFIARLEVLDKEVLATSADRMVQGLGC